MFVISKIVTALFDPFMVLLLLFTLAAALLFTRRRGLGQAMLLAGLAVWGASAVLPVEAWLIAPLESRFPQAPPPDTVEGIIVLGGAIDPAISAARGQVSMGGGAERVLALADLARRYPDARLVYSGGSGSVLDQDHKEAPYARRQLDSLCMDTSRVLFEGQSRNTRENAILSRSLAQPSGQGSWLLVTSAIHMPRAMGTFRADGWKVAAYPVDYTTTGTARPALSASAGLRQVAAAAKEWLGLAYYRLRGWSDALYPAP